MAIIILDVGLAGTHAQALLEEFAKVKSNLPLFLQLVRALRVFRSEDTYHANFSGSTHRFHKSVHRHVGMLMPGVVVCLVSNTLASFVSSLAVSEIKHLFHR